MDKDQKNLITRVYKKTTELQDLLRSLMEVSDEGHCTFIRKSLGVWKGNINWSAWKLLIDMRSNLNLVVYSNRGYEIFVKNDNLFQLAEVSTNVELMFFSRDKETIALAEGILEETILRKYQSLNKYERL